MVLSGWKSIIARLTFDLWLSVIIFALPTYWGYGATLLGFLVFPFYLEGCLFYFISDLAFSLPSDHWTPFTFWSTVLALIALAIVTEAKALIFRFNH